eukprot:6181171-Pleurochrysis_carterae.AAC.3
MAKAFLVAAAGLTRDAMVKKPRAWAWLDLGACSGDESDCGGGDGHSDGESEARVRKHSLLEPFELAAAQSRGAADEEEEEPTRLEHRQCARDNLLQLPKLVQRVGQLRIDDREEEADCRLALRVLLQRPRDRFRVGQRNERRAESERAHGAEREIAKHDAGRTQSRGKGQAALVATGGAGRVQANFGQCYEREHPCKMGAAVWRCRVRRRKTFLARAADLAVPKNPGEPAISNQGWCTKLAGPALRYTQLLRKPQCCREQQQTTVARRPVTQNRGSVGGKPVRGLAEAASRWPRPRAHERARRVRSYELQGAVVCDPAVPHARCSRAHARRI